MEFQSLPNFRAVVAGKLYRSSTVDNVTPDDVEKLSNLGIKTIVDLRSVEEFNESSAPRLMDNTFQVVRVEVQDRKPQPPELRFSVKETGSYQDKRHYIVSCYNRHFFTGVLQRKPWYLKIYIILTMILAWLVDTALRTKMKYLKKAIVPIVLSKDQGILQWYKDMVDFSTGSMFAALKILSDPQNQPALVSCKYGKDRTAIIAALVQGILGRKKADIIEDYHKSEVWLCGILLAVHWFLHGGFGRDEGKYAGITD
ncbi:Hypp7683 [Branchiostoma lanceolatum]|uniref:Hypp7683 protein n=1 Tax=Branchiostoma lanceolatum TaxID=7740 RepID=A0A8K0EBM9_BRALA|nr:Hypp7683 [Branchiostoma lanceolatum]